MERGVNADDLEDALSGLTGGSRCSVASLSSNEMMTEV